MLITTGSQRVKRSFLPLFLFNIPLSHTMSPGISDPDINASIKSLESS